MKSVYLFLSLMTIILVSSVYIYLQEVYRVYHEEEIDFVSPKALEQTQKLAFYEIIDGTPIQSLFDVETTAYQKNDTIDLELIAGFLQGHRLKIQIVKNSFRCKLFEFNCTSRSNFQTKKQELQMDSVNFFENSTTLKGSIHYEGVKISNHKRELPQTIRVKGYFEVDVEQSM